MKKVKNINKEPRQAYEPVQVKVTKVTPQVILCQSGGGEDEGTIVSISSYEINDAI